MSTASPRATKRSLGVTSIALFGIVSSLWLGYSIFNIAGSRRPSLLLALEALLALVAAVGLLARRNWARLSYIGLMTITVLNIAVQYRHLIGSPSALLSGALVGGFAALIIAHLCSRAVRAEFNAD